MQLGSLLPKGAPLRQTWTDAERLARFDAAGAAYEGGVTEANLSAFVDDDGFIVLDGEATAAAATVHQFLLQELVPATRGGASFVGVPSNARQQSVFGDVDVLSGFTTSVVLPALVRIASLVSA